MNSQRIISTYWDTVVEKIKEQNNIKLYNSAKSAKLISVNETEMTLELESPILKMMFEADDSLTNIDAMLTAEAGRPLKIKIVYPAH